LIAKWSHIKCCIVKWHKSAKFFEESRFWHSNCWFV
jgi:hypothetical protein